MDGQGTHIVQVGNLEQVCVLATAVLQGGDDEAGQKGAGRWSEVPEKAAEHGRHSTWGHWVGHAFWHFLSSQPTLAFLQLEPADCCWSTGCWRARVFTCLGHGRGLCWKRREPRWVNGMGRQPEERRGYREVGGGREGLAVGLSDTVLGVFTFLASLNPHSKA